MGAYIHGGFNVGFYSIAKLDTGQCHIHLNKIWLDDTKIVNKIDLNTTILPSHILYLIF